MGPDLNVNGDVGETETDGTSGGDSAAQPAQDSQTSTEGNSMLGKHTHKTSFLLPAWLSIKVTEDLHSKMFQITENKSKIVSLNLEA